MCALTKSGANDDAADCLTSELVLACYGGDGAAGLLGNSVDLSEHVLESLPTASGIDKALVFHERPITELLTSRFRFSKPFIRDKATAQGAVSQNLDPRFIAIFRHGA